MLTGCGSAVSGMCGSRCCAGLRPMSRFPRERPARGGELCQRPPAAESTRRVTAHVSTGGRAVITALALAGAALAAVATCAEPTYVRCPSGAVCCMRTPPRSCCDGAPPLASALSLDGTRVDTGRRRANSKQ
eukprot:4163262-Prymnesium_polylepis.1